MAFRAFPSSSSLLLVLILAPAIARADVPPPGQTSGSPNLSSCDVDGEELKRSQTCEACRLAEPAQEQISCAAQFEGTDFVFICINSGGLEVWCKEGGGCSYAPLRDAAPPLGVAASGLAAAAAWLIRRRRRPAR